MKITIAKVNREKKRKGILSANEWQINRRLLSHNWGPKLSNFYLMVLSYGFSAFILWFSNIAKVFSKITKNVLQNINILGQITFELIESVLYLHHSPVHLSCMLIYMKEKWCCGERDCMIFYLLNWQRFYNIHNWAVSHKPL